MPAAKQCATSGLTTGTFTNYPAPLHPSTPSAMVINQDIIPPHAYYQISVLQPIYKRLSPDNIIQLMAGDELIVVIPVFDHTKSPDHALHVCHSYIHAHQK
jgi:hypothetical protein